MEAAKQSKLDANIVNQQKQASQNINDSQLAFNPVSSAFDDKTLNVQRTLAPKPAISYQ